jgi:hypothetical protein
MTGRSAALSRPRDAGIPGQTSCRRLRSGARSFPSSSDPCRLRSVQLSCRAPSFRPLPGKSLTIRPLTRPIPAGGPRGGPTVAQNWQPAPPFFPKAPVGERALGARRKACPPAASDRDHPHNCLPSLSSQRSALQSVDPNTTLAEWARPLEPCRARTGLLPPPERPRARTRPPPTPFPSVDPRLSSLPARGPSLSVPSPPWPAARLSRCRHRRRWTWPREGSRIPETRPAPSLPPRNGRPVCS